jgi:CBS domain-containing protein
MAIGEICNREVVVAERSLPVVECAKLMRTHHVGDVVVVENHPGGRRPVGIVTDRDIVVEVVAANVMPDTLTIGDIMGPELVTVLESEGVFEVIRYMRAKGVRRVPVISKEGSLLGIVTLDDLLELLSEEIRDLAGLLSRERLREETSRK